jgi:hypothetical protein
VQEVASSPPQLVPEFSQELEQAEEQPQEMEKSVQDDLQTTSGAGDQEQERRMVELNTVMWGGKKLRGGLSITSKQGSKWKVTEVLTPGSYILKKAKIGSSDVLPGGQVPGVPAGVEVAVQQEGGMAGEGLHH